MSNIWRLRPLDESKSYADNSILTYINLYSDPVADALHHPFFKNMLKRRSYLTIPEFVSVMDDLVIEEPMGYVRAIVQIAEHMIDKGDILVYGDYDVDGMTATASLYSCIKSIYDSVTYAIPDRVKNGYGLDPALVRENLKPGGLVITVDCGTNNTIEINQLLSEGYKVIVTDHHLQEVETLAKVIVINPKVKVDSTHPEYMAPGVYIASRLGMYLLQAKGVGYGQMVSQNIHSTVLTAFGIVSDVIELNPLMMNVLRTGLTYINSPACPDGIRSLLTTCSARENQDVNSIFMAYSVVPKINAAGRMGDTKAAMELLLTKHDSSHSKHVTADLAQYLKDLNLKRKEIENNILVEAQAQLLEQKQKYPHGVVLYSKDWYPGVLGIIASRLVDEYNIPIIVTALEHDEIKGSGRSMDSYNLHQIVGSCSEHLSGYGGHKVAIGVQFKEENLEHFRQAFDSKIAEIGTSPKVIDFDDAVDIKNLLDVDFQQILSVFEPHGNGNPEMVFLLQDVKVIVVEEARDVTTLVVRDKNDVTLAISKYKAPKHWVDYLYTNVDVLLTPTYNYYTGTAIMEYKITDIGLTQDTKIEGM